MFKNGLLEALEIEFEEKLGYNKYQVSEKNTTNSRNGYSKKTVKFELGTVEINVPRDRNGEFEPQSLLSIKETLTVSRIKFYLFIQQDFQQEISTIQIKELYDVEISA